MLTRQKPIQIRDLTIDPPLLLAPMAGLTHSALRQVMSGFGGIGLLSTEMLSARRLPTENPAISPYLIRTDSERPVSYQLLTSTPGELGRAIDALHACKADTIDLNMGCPAPAVGHFGAGISLMEQPANVRRIVAEARRLTSLPLTAKIRLDLDEDKLMNFCHMLEDEGIDMLSIHARLKHESFARNPRWAGIARVKERLSIPVIANGGIFSIRDAQECLRLSGADGLMLGRGAVVRPWLFAGIAREVCGCSIAESEVSLPAAYGMFVDLLDTHFRPEYRLGRLKQFTHYFAQNFQFGHYLASKIQTSMSLDDAREKADRFFASQENVNMPVSGC